MKRGVASRIRLFGDRKISENSHYFLKKVKVIGHFVKNALGGLVVGRKQIAVDWRVNSV